MDEPKETLPEDRRYRRAARLLATKLGVDWRELPAEQVLDYARKLDIAAEKKNENQPKDNQ